MISVPSEYPNLKSFQGLPKLYPETLVILFAKKSRKSFNRTDRRILCKLYSGGVGKYDNYKIKCEFSHYIT